MDAGNADEYPEAASGPNGAEVEPAQLGIAATLMPKLKPGDDNKSKAHNAKLITDAALELRRSGGDVNILRQFLESRIDHSVLDAAFTNSGKRWEKERRQKDLKVIQGELDRHNDRNRGSTKFFKLVNLDDLAMSTTSEYCIKGLIPRKGLVIVWGPPKCGKSFKVFAWMMHIGPSCSPD